MIVGSVEPLRRAWARAQRMLLKPFDLRTWLVLGFAAFLSQMTLAGQGMRSSLDDGGGHGASRFLHDGGWLAGGLLAGLGMLFVAAAVILVVALMWINSRGRFVFLDDVARERAAIVEPWKRYGRQGDALFVWLLLFGIVCVGVVVAMALPFLATLAAVYSDGEFHWGMLGALWVLMAFVAPFAIFVAYVMLFLHDFVVPLMYRDGLGPMEAWQRFLALFRARPGPFVLYGLFVFVIGLAIVALIAVVGVSTCCIGFLLLGVPYVSHVVLLPVLVTLRGLGPEFLAQFGPEYTVFAPAPSGESGGSGAPVAPPDPGGTPPTGGGT